MDRNLEMSLTKKLGMRHSITYLILAMALKGFLGFLDVGYGNRQTEV